MARLTDGTPRQTYAMRIGDDERQIVQAAAAQCDIPLSTYIRRVALSAAHLELAGELEEGPVSSRPR